MKMFDLHERLVNVDVRQSSYPLKHHSKSKLQGIVGEKLVELFPRSNILEEFQVPGSRLSVDYFIVDKKLIIEVQGEGHLEVTPIFHGAKETTTKFAKQKKRDAQKAKWCELNGFELIEIWSKDDLELLNGR